MSKIAKRTTGAVKRTELDAAAIAVSTNVDDLKETAKKARARATALKTVLGERGEHYQEMADDWTLAVSCDRRLGELCAEIAALPKLGRPKRSGSTVLPLPKLADLGITKTQSKRWQDLARVPEADFKAYVETTTAKLDKLSLSGLMTSVQREQSEAKREARRATNRAKIAGAVQPTELVGTARFATIVIDPPWDWGDEGDVDQLGRARPDYATMSIEEIKRLPVAALADVDCHLYLWITNRSLPKGFALLDAWGFRYVTALTWVKPHYGLGNYFRGQSEHVLFGVRGSQMLRRKDVGTVFHAARGAGGHSSKPPEFYSLVESCSPGPYLEMFARADRAGWSQWGEGE